ncbi:DUF4199 domain-containing protein [Aquimarina sp. AD10]|uniref:DUF4199 domain-containing protein n=1 Tax=Aquimarina aggregata TaxID=1642818 RepID=A0A162ZXD1_9FLAO|nr:MULTISPECIES: DUF4199 domain-containing protein [Aquimarina]AXT61449.1 DUF4199 domain-containing protein [Aquimarina sp. AD10]KZS40109.1 hypothetical protein AWE51_25295 [Aquimarina aggregata]RKM89934.1 DUF4199 domain-containing protein [Aquimarina sp. AD10]
MKKVVIKYGLLSAASICVLALAGWFLGKSLDYSIQEVIGYAGMIISLLFVFFGIKFYRDNENGGIVSFGKALLIGILITLIAALAFGILDVIYIKYINPDFMAEYYAHYIQEIKNTLPEAEFKIELAKLESQKELFSNIFMNFFLMFATVLIIGFIISLISAVLLQRKPAADN